ncbi:MAG: hypothetical protein V1907_00165 [Candidatus Kerfeldbacteria bacterium]
METSPIENKVLSDIRSKRIAMRSRRSIVRRNAMFGVALGAFAVLLLLFGSFVAYSLHRTGILYLPACGTKALSYMLHPFSWFNGVLFAMFNLLGIAFAVFLGRKTAIYRAPLIYVLFATAVVVIGGGFLIFLTPLNRVVGSIANKHQIPIIAPLFQKATSTIETHTTPGLVRNVQSGSFELVTFSKKVVEVRTTPLTTFLHGFVPKNNDVVIVVGTTKDGVIEADVIHEYPGKLTPEEISELTQVQQ